MTEPYDPEGVALPAEVAEQVLRLLDAPDPLAPPRTGSAAGEQQDLATCPVAVRELLEAWAALPLALEPAAPGVEARQRLLARVRADVAAPEVRARRPSRLEAALPWLLPLAATLVVALLALSAGLWSRLDEQNRRIARLTRQVEALGAAPATASMQARLDAMEGYLRVVSTPGVAVCPLRLRAPEGAHSSARGILYVAPDHQHWYLALSGLRPAPQGQSYHLWFFVDDRPVSAGTFAARPGEIVRLGSDTMPEGTRAVGITLEPREQMERPSGEPILFGDEVTQVT